MTETFRINKIMKRDEGGGGKKEVEKDQKWDISLIFLNYT